MLSFPSRSTVEIKAGLTAKGEVRSELRSWSDCKPAFMREDTVEASRSKRGRPSKESVPDKMDQDQNKPIGNDPPNLGHSRPIRSTRNQSPNYLEALVALIDFSTPPPPLPGAGNSNLLPTHADHRPWSASSTELKFINQSIAGSPVRCEARG